MICFGWMNPHEGILAVWVSFWLFLISEILLLVVKAEIFFQLFVQLVDEDLLASFKNFNDRSLMPSSSESVALFVLLQLMVIITGYSSITLEKDLLVFLKVLSMKNPKSDFRQKVFRYFFFNWIQKKNQTDMLEVPVFGMPWIIYESQDDIHKSG